jgi:ABC-2 type transport system ATP-binding protein
MPPAAVETRALTRRFGGKRGGLFSPRKEKETVALAGLDIEMRAGEVFGLLGPNGAGKTTLIKILSTLLLPTSGEAKVEGLDVVRDAAEVRRRITMVSGGEHSGYGILNVRENIWMFAQFYGIPGKVARARTEALLERLGMSADGSTRVNKLSTGMRQKMNIIRGFVCDPSILFLDEPTLGLDVQVAREVRSLVREWAQGPGTAGMSGGPGTAGISGGPGTAGMSGGPGGAESRKTVLLTTHYMQEADELCDRIAIIDRGKVLACETPAALKRRLRSETVFHLEVAGLAPGADGLGALPGVARVCETGEAEGVRKLAVGLREEPAIAGLIAAIVARGATLVSLAKVEPSLEDVFVSLVGRGLGEEVAEAVEAREP